MAGNQRTSLEKQLIKAIKSSDMTSYRISKVSGVSEGVISRFVNTERTITLSTAAKLADALGLELKPAKRYHRKSKGS